MLKVDFEFETQYGKFADAIWYSEDAPMSDEEIEAEKQRRLANWIAIIENPPPPQEDPLPEPQE